MASHLTPLGRHAVNDQPSPKMTSPSSDQDSTSEYDAVLHTANTSLMFSPENGLSGSGKSYKSCVRGSDADPFSAPRSGLNAEASDFKPVMSASSKTFKAADAGKTFTTQYLHDVIAKNSHISAGSLMRSGTFTRDSGASRTIEVITKTQGSALDSVKNYMAYSKYNAQGHISFFPNGNNKLHIHCNDVRDATFIHDLLSAARNELGDVKYCDTLLLAQVVPHLASQFTSYEGQIVLKIALPANAKAGVIRMGIEAEIRDGVKEAGSICAYQTMPVPGDNTMCMLLELHDITRVAHVVKALNGRQFNGETLSVAPHHPDMKTNPYGHYDQSSLDDLSQSMMSMNLGKEKFATAPSTGYTPSLGTASTMASGSVSTPQRSSQGFGNTMYAPQGAMTFAYSAPAAASNQGLMGITSNSMVPYAPGQVIMMAPMPLQQYAFQPMGYALETSNYATNGGYYGGYSGRGRGGPRYMGSNSYRPHARQYEYDHLDHKKPENIVGIDRIQHGLDVRTTIMLRNIPNKMTQAQLQDLLMRISGGKFDFMYLRIDFSNDCNVGYAFINYIDPIDIVAIVLALAGHRWPEEFRSDKVAEISYATIQGRDCLIQKFRNSSVMLEKAECRPKLFYTEGHPMCGLEEDFPSSDNQSKLKRSCENAEHVGLFAPAVGQQHRADQRSRISQWDRGTTLAVRERNSFGGGYGRGGRGAIAYDGNDDEAFQGFGGRAGYRYE